MQNVSSGRPEDPHPNLSQSKCHPAWWRRRPTHRRRNRVRFRKSTPSKDCPVAMESYRSRKALFGPTLLGLGFPVANVVIHQTSDRDRGAGSVAPPPSVTPHRSSGERRETLYRRSGKKRSLDSCSGKSRGIVVGPREECRARSLLPTLGRFDSDLA